MLMRALLTPPECGRTTLRVAANSATGIGVPNTYGAQAPIHDEGAFFMPASSGAHACSQFAAGGAGEPQGSPVRRPVRQSRVARHPLRNAGAAVIQHTETANHE